MEPSRADREAVDPTLSERLRLSADARIAERIEAGRRRAAAQIETRAAFTARRNAGLRIRNGTRAARLSMINNHQTKESQA